MNNLLASIISLLITFSLAGEMAAQSIITIDNCGVSYIDPQDAVTKTAPSHDTVVYQTRFEETNQQRAYYVDINAFGGQQVDRATVKAILPDGTLQPLGTLAFGNCIDCARGFAFVYNDSIWVEDVANRETMDLWLASFNQPPFSLTSNLQTLRGVGRLSGLLPACAEGIFVEFIVYSDPSSTTTEFAAQVVCPEIVRDCSIELAAEPDCQKDSLYLRAIIPPDCYSSNARIRWWNGHGFEAVAAEAALPFSGNEGMYYFELEEAYCSFTDSIWVENPAFAEAGADQTVCRGEEVVLLGGGGVQYFWESPRGEITEGPQLLVPSVEAGDGGRYLLRAFNEAGCEDTDTLYLDVRETPAPEVMITDACLGDSVRFFVLNDSAFSRINWFDPQGSPLVDPFIQQLDESAFGDYAATGVDAFGCRASVEFPVAGRQPPDFNYAIEDSCDSTRVFLSPAEYQYEWSTGRRGPALVTATGGTFEVTISDDEGCQTIASVEVPPPDGPDVSLNVEHPRCPNEFGAIELALANPDQPAIFSLDGGASYTLSSRFENLAPGNYTLLVQDDLGCTQQFFAEIIAPDTLGVHIQSEALEVRPGAAIQLEAETAGNATRYQWLPREIDTGTSRTEFIAETNLDIRLIVEDARGCLVSDGLPLTIVLGDLYAPNAFSPNGDGTNDRFILYSDNSSGEIIEILRIFDRFGELLFETENILPNDEARGWAGIFRGKEMNSGVYVYQAVVRFGNGERKAYEGDVLLMR
jgi:gliding motility-associated-like protein